MSTDPGVSLAQKQPAAFPPAELESLLAGGLGELSLREAVGWLLSNLGEVEWRQYLQRTPEDKGNGAYTRSLERRPKPCCRPAGLQPLGQAAKAALQSLGLSCPETELDQVAQGLIEELELKNTRPGRENLEDWKAVLRDLIERGLRRVLLLVQDDFSGLLGITHGWFPNTDLQLCTVHLLRDVRSHLSKPHAAEFKQRFNLIEASWDPDQTAQAFDDLCQHFAEAYSTFIAGVQKKRPHYLAFIHYPDAIRRTLSTTNVVEAIKGRLEICAGMPAAISIPTTPGNSSSVWPSTSLNPANGGVRPPMSLP